jgi:two-component system, NtrC family, sensor histidine kinase PilS
MPGSSKKSVTHEVTGLLQVLMLLRVVVVSVLLGASVVIQIRQTHVFLAEIQTIHYIIIVSIYFLTFIYALLLKHTKNHHTLSYLQLIVDTFLVTAIIYTTGGIDSIFSFLYILTIINASIILYRRGGYVIASFSSILYGLLLDLHFYDIIQPLGTRGTAPLDYGNLNIFYLILVNITAFYIVAYLSGYLSEQIRRSRVELKERQQDIITLELLNKSIIDSISSGLAAVGAGGKIILFNPAAEKIFGIEAESVLGKNAVEAIPFLSPYYSPDKPGSVGGKLSEQPFSDFNHTLPDGRQLHLRVSAAPLRLPRRQSGGTIFLFQDVTEIMRIEAEMKRVEDLALIGELAAGMAHEIRNPMASISGSIQMLRDGLDAEDVNSRLMDIIMRETERLNRLIGDFLSFARPRTPTIKTFDLNRLVGESLQLFRNSRRCKGKIDIVEIFHEPVVVASDQELIRQILWNLYLNAADAMPDGGRLFVTTAKSAAQCAPGLTGARIEVRDTGPGFSYQALNHLFTPFFTTKEGGSGLGLATVRRVVESLGGSVQGCNDPHGGAVVTIFFHGLPPQCAVEIGRQGRWT